MIKTDEEILEEYNKLRDILVIKGYRLAEKFENRRKKIRKKDKKV